MMTVQIQTLQQAIRRKLKRFLFEGSDVQIAPGCAIFITTSTK